MTEKANLRCVTGLICFNSVILQMTQTTQMICEWEWIIIGMFIEQEYMKDSDMTYGSNWSPLQIRKMSKLIPIIVSEYFIPFELPPDFLCKMTCYEKNKSKYKRNVKPLDVTFINTV